MLAWVLADRNPGRKIVIGEQRKRPSSWPHWCCVPMARIESVQEWRIATVLLFQPGSWGWPVACIFLKLPITAIFSPSWGFHVNLGIFMSTRSARLTRANSAKQTLRSSRGFGSRPDRTTRESRQVDRCDPVEEQRPVTSPAPHREICSICLEALDDSCFNFPCGQNHRLHYGCMIHFLGSILALPLSDDSPGPLLKEQVRDLGQGWKAIGVP